jgi:hypothetical protein
MARIGSGLWKKVGSKSGVKNGSGERSGAVYLLDSSSQILKCVKAKPVVRQGRKVAGLVFFQGFSRRLGHHLVYLSFYFFNHKETK